MHCVRGRTSCACTYELHCSSNINAIISTSLKLKYVLSNHLMHMNNATPTSLKKFRDNSVMRSVARSDREGGGGDSAPVASPSTPWGDATAMVVNL